LLGKSCLPAEGVSPPIWLLREEKKQQRQMGYCKYRFSMPEMEACMHEDALGYRTGSRLQMPNSRVLQSQPTCKRQYFSVTVVAGADTCQ
jgi:hypothetical protein